MEGFVKFITSPAWWGVILSAISTIAVIAIAFVQIRLQKRQTELQEYDVYRKLYILLRNANTEIDFFLDKLNNALWEPRYNADKEYLQRWLNSINKLINDLRESYVDYELKLSKDTFEKRGYLDILSRMSTIVHQTIISLQQGEVCLQRGAQQISFMQDTKDEAFATAIAKHYRGGTLPSIMMGEFAIFIKLKRAVRCDDSLLESIRAKCKIE